MPINPIAPPAPVARVDANASQANAHAMSRMAAIAKPKGADATPDDNPQTLTSAYGVARGLQVSTDNKTGRRNLPTPPDIPPEEDDPNTPRQRGGQVDTEA